MATYCLLENNLARLVLGVRIHALSNLGNSSFAIPPNKQTGSPSIPEYPSLSPSPSHTPIIAVGACHGPPLPSALAPDISATTSSRVRAPCKPTQFAFLFHRAAGSKSATTFFVLQPILNDTVHVQLIHRPLDTHRLSRFPFPSRQNPNPHIAVTPPRIAYAPGPRSGRFRLYFRASNPPAGGMSLHSRVRTGSYPTVSEPTVDKV